MKELLLKYKKIPLPAKASLWFVICSFIQRGISMITTPIFARILTVDNYGATAIYSSWVEIVTIFATFQLATGVFPKAMIKFEDDRDGYTSSTLLMASMTTLACFGIYLIRVDLFNKLFELDTIVVIMMFVDIFFSTAMSMWTARNRFEYKYVSVVAITLTVNILGPALSVLLILSAPSTEQVVMRIAGSVIVKAVLYSGVYLKILHKGKRLYNKNYWNYAFKYNLPLIPHYLSQQVLNQADRIMIDHMCGKYDAGLYSLGYQISRAIFIFTLAVHSSFTPWSYERISKKEFKDLGKKSLYFEIGTGVVCFYFALFAPEMIYIMGGKEYLSTVWIVPAVSMSILFQTVYTFFSNIEFFYEHTGLVMVASIIVSIVNVILNWIFIPLYGFIAAGYTTLACYILYSIVHYFFMLYICKKEEIVNPYNGKIMWSIAIIITLISLLINFLYMYSTIRYVFIAIMTIGAAFFLKKHGKSVLSFLRNRA